MVRRPLLFLAASAAMSGVSACGGSPPPPPVAVVQMPPIVPEPPPVDPRQPVIVPRSALLARWHEGPLAHPLSPLASPRLVEAGEKGALVRTGGGEVFVVQEARGVLGPVPLPEGAKWIGTDDQDRVYAATRDGDLWVAETPDDAVKGKLVRTGAVKGGVDWDFTAGMVVTARGDEVLVSRDRGATFTASRPRRGSTVRSVFARFDGAIAVRMEGRGRKAAQVGDVYLSRDRGRTWHRSAYTPANLRRDGAFIWDGDWVCPALLTGDARGFTADHARQEGFSSLPSWTSLLATRTTPYAAPPLTRLQVTSPLPPPSITGKGQTDPSRCHHREAAILASLEGGVVGGVLTTLGHGDGMAVGGLLGGIRVCRGASCIAGTIDAVPETTRTGFAFFEDGVCRDSSPGGRACVPGSPLLRLPHVAHVDHGSGKVQVEDVPAGCDPERIGGAGGLGVLLCKAQGGSSAVWTRPGDGPWAVEGTLPVRSSEIWAITQSPDGTLMLHPSCPAGVPCRALVRAPKPAGDSSAWREVEVKKAVAYRVADEGAALAVVPGKDDRRFSLVLAAPGASPRPLAEEVDAGDRNLYDLRLDAEGRVIVSGSAGRGRTESWWVTRGGTLESVPPDPGARRRGRTYVRARPMDPARIGR